MLPSGPGDDSASSVRPVQGPLNPRASHGACRSTGRPPARIVIPPPQIISYLSLSHLRSPTEVPFSVPAPLTLTSPQIPGAAHRLAVPSATPPPMPGSNPIRKKQSEVIIRATRMPSSSPPTLPGLTSGSESPSISSVETRSDSGSVAGLGLGPVLTRRVERHTGPEENARAPVITGMTGESRARSQTSSSSWSTAAPSASSAVPSLADSDLHLDLNLNVDVDVDVDVNPAESGIYACLFHMLDCHNSFDDATQWRTHVLSHFRTHPPPRTARCPLCPDTEFIDQDADQSSISSLAGPADSSATNLPHPNTAMATATSMSSQDHPSAWDRLLNHVATDHYQHGQTLAGSRPDFELMRYLYGRRIISDAQFKAMQLAPAPSSPAYHRSQDGVRASIGSADEPYCAPYSRRREERMRGQQRGVSVVL